jgi:hypothetical protein
MIPFRRAFILRTIDLPSAQALFVMCLMRLTFAIRVAAATINVRRVFHCLALDAAVFAGLKRARAWRMSAFFCRIGCHFYLPRNVA